MATTKTDKWAGFTHRAAYYATDSVGDLKPRVVRAVRDGGFYDRGGGAGVYPTMEAARLAAEKLNAEAGLKPSEAQAIVVRSMFPESVVTPADFAYLDEQ